MKTGKTCYTLIAKNLSRSASQRPGSPVHLAGSPRSERRTRKRAKLASLPVTSATRDESEPAPGGRAAPAPGARAGGELRHGALAAVPRLGAGRSRSRSRSRPGPRNTGRSAMGSIRSLPLHGRATRGAQRWGRGGSPGPGTELVGEPCCSGTCFPHSVSGAGCCCHR